MPTKIEWADEVWNPVIGCTKCSPGCMNCYAERFAARLWRMGRGDYGSVLGIEDYKWNGEILCRKSFLDKPLHWHKPRRIFVCSMSDLFHPKVNGAFRGDVFDVIRKTPQHTYLILTKRAERMAKVANILIRAHGEKYFRHVQWGTSISTQLEADKNIPFLLQIQGGAVRWLNIEPMLEGIDLEPHTHHSDCNYNRGGTCDCEGGCDNVSPGENWLENISGVVVGGETGPGAKPMHPDWPRNIRDQCVATNTPFYFKQWGEWLSGAEKYALKINTYQHYYPKRVTRIGNTTFFRVGKKKAGCILDGKKWEQLPERK